MARMFSESQFSDRLNTNYVPSDGEIGHIRMDLVLRSEELARIDAHICELSAQRDKIQAYIHAHKALISLPRRLPQDIVGEIFVACLPMSRNAVMSAQEAPLLLCRICSAWRTIALSTPRLWTSLHVPFGFVLAKESRMLAVAQWLQRSAACLISLSISHVNQRSWEDQEEEPEMKDVQSARRESLLKSLTASMARWRDVDFQNISFKMAYELQIAKVIDRPLSLESFKFSGRLSALNLLDLCFAAPNLHTVALRLKGTDPLDEFVLSMPLSWNRLENLVLDSNGSGFSLLTVISLLGRCTQLVSLYITPESNDAEIDFVSAPLSLPFLQSFTLSRRFLTSCSLGRLLGHMSMPQLRHFHAGATTCEHGAQHSFFLVRLGKTSPLMEETTIYLLSLTTQSLLDTLRSFPSLIKLVAVDTDVWGWDGTVLTPSLAHLFSLLTDTNMCPMLQELGVRNCARVEKAMLHAFMQARIGTTESAHRPLRRLEITFQESCTPDVELLSAAEIQSYLSQGVEISIFDDNWDGPLVSPGPWPGLPPDDS
ncbi:hypothetical protein MVEN_00837700 [Mycena venus]|uniref:F-box domain-containing protein n=1 Tax=Mycena venus TaxID=2733690 RepID=A0A8H7D3Z4_9AGAR|nr:hypothetical protein MVEN_00837700 [Mycena venus]